MPGVFMGLLLAAQVLPNLTPSSSNSSNSKPALDRSASISVNSMVTLNPPKAVAGDLASLKAVVNVALRLDLSTEVKQSMYNAMVRGGRVFELKEPTRAVIRKVIKDDAPVDINSGKPMLAIEGRLSQAASTQRTAFFLAAQLDEVGVSNPPPPSPEELAQIMVAEQAALEREQEIYRAFRTGKAEAKGRAGGMDLSVRKRVEARGLHDLASRLIKKFHLKPGELEAIVEVGETKDGTAARYASKHSPAVAEAKFRNDVNLSAMDQVINSGIDATLADAAKWRSTPMVGRSFNPLGINGFFYAQRRPNTITADVNYRPLQGR